jgi:hypothetical protein
MAMHIARRLSEAVGSWMHLEFCCFRSGLMSEAALKGAVGQVLSSVPSSVEGSRVHAELHHDALRAHAGGRKRSLDFALAVLPDSGPCTNVEIAVETKWAGSSHCHTKAIAEDFIRLALVKRANPNARCIFFVAGTFADLCTVLSSHPFTSSKGRNSGIHLSNSPRRFRFDALKATHRSMFQLSIRNWLPHSAIPASIVTCAHGTYPSQTTRGTVHFQSIAWEVTAVDATDLRGQW